MPTEEPIADGPTPEELAQGQRFAEWLRVERARRDWTRLELSQRSGVSGSYISLIEGGGIKHTGQYQLPSEEILTKLAVALGIEPKRVLAAAGHPLPDIEYVPDIDALLGRMEGYSDFDGTERVIIREAALKAAANMAETLRKLGSRGTIGSRFTRDEIVAEERAQYELSKENNTVLPEGLVKEL